MAQIWAKANVAEYAAILEKETEVPAAVWVASFDQDATEYTLLTPETVAYQQEVANIFYDLKLIPEPLEIAQVVWYGAED